tara:strand:- start:163 stop:1125 length:963 start_codon:yes stop_codon:yes gene_type:complete
MNVNNLVSIIIPSFNSSLYLKDCVDSLICQTYQNIEILICDDGSTDASFDIAEQLCFADERIHLFRNKVNQGVVKTRNRLIKLAKGEFIALQDADDKSDPNRITKQIQFLITFKELNACGTGYIKIDNKDLELFNHSFPSNYSDIFKCLPKKFEFLCGSVMFKSSYLKENLYSEFFDNSGNEDLYLMGKLIINSKYENLPDKLYYYRKNINSLTKLGEEGSLRKLYISEITEKLITDLKYKKTNWIESGNIEELCNYENSLKNDLTNSLFLLVEKNVGQMLYWKEYKTALRISVNNILTNGINQSNIKLLFYVLKKYLIK